MEWKKYYMDMMLVPLGLVIILAYHILLCHKCRTQPFTTIMGRDADGRRFWVGAMMKDIDKKHIVAVHSLRNIIMGTTLMATTSILLCAGLGAVISSSYSVKKSIDDSVYGANGEVVVTLKYAIILTILSSSFLCHTLAAGFVNQVNILICTPQDVKSMVTPEYLTEHMRKATILNVVGNRLFYSALSLTLWIFGPVLPFLSSIVMVFVLYKLDFVPGKNSNNKVEDLIQNQV